MLVWTLKKQFLKFGVLWYNLCQLRAVDHELCHETIPEKKKLGLFKCKYLQWAALYVNKNTITGKTYLNTTFVY